MPKFAPSVLTALPLVFLFTFVACGDDAVTGTSGSSGGESSSNGSGGNSEGGSTGETHEAWSISEAFKLAVDIDMYFPRDVAGMADGSAYVVGSGFGLSSPRLARYDADGNAEAGWPLTLPDNTSDSGLERVVALDDGSVVVSAQGANDWLAIRYAVDGTLLWSKNHSPNPNSRAVDMVGTPGGGVAILVSTHSGGPFNDFGCSLVLYDADGNELTGYTAPATKSDGGYIGSCSAVGIDPDNGDYLLLGMNRADAPWNSDEALPALHRVGADWSGASTESRIVRWLGFGGVAQIDARGDSVSVSATRSGDTYSAYTTAAFGIGTSDSQETTTTRQAYRLPFGSGPLVLRASQEHIERPITLEVVTGAHAPGFAVASESFDVGPHARIYSADAAGDSVWTAWAENGLPRVWLARHKVTSTTADGPGPEPTVPPAHSHTFEQLADVELESYPGSFWVERMVTAPNGDLYVLGRVSSALNWEVRRLGSDGSPSTGSWPHAFDFPTFPYNLDTAATPDIAVLSDGSLILTEVGDFGWRTQRVLVDGTVDWSANYGISDYHPAGLVVDSQDRIIVFGSVGAPAGTPHVDCRAIRYDADGNFEDAYEVDVTAGSDPALTRCGAGVLDPAGGGLVLAGYSDTEVPNYAEPAHALARLDANGTVLAAKPTDDDLFGITLSSRPEVASGSLVALADGTLVASYTYNHIASTPPPPMTRLVALKPDGTPLRSDWLSGALCVGALDNGRILTVHQQGAVNPIEIRVLDIGDDGFVVAGATSFSPIEEWTEVNAIAVGPGNTFWVNYFDDNTVRMRRYEVKVK